MADPNQIRTQLLPVDKEKGYPQFGHLINPDLPPTQNNIEWTNRVSNSFLYRETHSGFEQDKVYEVEFRVAGYPNPFTSTATGAQLAPNDANGFPTERQANYPYAQIGQLPTYYKLTPVNP